MGAYEFDPTNPTVSGLAAVPALAGIGVNVTISFTVSEELSASPAVTINGNPATLTGKSGLDYDYEYLAQASDTTGFATIGINAVDIAGNLGITTDSTLLTLDSTIPAVSNLTALPAPAGIGDSATISFTVSETLSTPPSVTVNGTAAALVGNVGLNFEYGYVVQASDTNGPASLAIDLIDLAGNPGGTADSSVLILDTIHPAVTNIVAAPLLAGIGTSVAISFTASESLLEQPSVTVNGNAATYAGNTGLDYQFHYVVLASDTSGLATLAIGITDLAGNAGGGFESTLLTLDTVAPSVSVDDLETEDATPVLSGSIDDAGASVSVTVNGQTVPAINHGSTWSIGDDVLNPLTPGTYDVEVHATDSAGNVGTDPTADELTISAPPMPAVNAYLLAALTALLALLSSLHVVRRSASRD
jgi:uncharacterized Zn-binding protein involved in type VI secretion